MRVCGHLPWCVICSHQAFLLNRVNEGHHAEGGVIISSEIGLENESLYPRNDHHCEMHTSIDGTDILCGIVLSHLTVQNTMVQTYCVV